MFKSYWKIAFRNLWRKKAFSFINIAGLAVGIAASLLIFLVIHSETSYDAWQSKYDRICRVVSTYTMAANGEVKDRQGAVPTPLPQTMLKEFPRIDGAAGVWNIGDPQIHVPGARGLEDEQIYKQDKGGIYFTDPALYTIFDYTWLEGNAIGLKDPNTAVIDKSTADKWFGSPAKAMGRTVEMWSFRIPLRIIGVYKDLPYNTDMEIHMGASFGTFASMKQSLPNDPENWKNTPWSSNCFVVLHKKEDRAAVQAALPGLVAKYYPKEQVSGPTRTGLYLQPLKDMHLDENFHTFKSDALSHRELWALAMIGIFLLLVACINFVNLATALSVSRAKEIGVRKVLGSNRIGLLRQFLQETALISVISILLGCLLAFLALPFLSDLMKKPLRLDIFQSLPILLFLVITGIVVTFLSGMYPGLILSRFNPAEALKSKISARTVGGISLRRGLVVVQFVIAQLLVIGTLVVIMQMQFFRNQSMGFEKKAVVMIDLPSDSLDRLQYKYLEAQMLKVPGVSAASYCMDAPATWGLPATNFFFDNDPVAKDFRVNMQFGDTGYLNTFRIGLLAGRIPFASDTPRELLVNETLIKRLGIRNPTEIIGKTMTLGNAPGATRFPIVGIMRDFNTASLRDPIPPLTLTTGNGYYGSLAVRMDADKMVSTLDKVHTIFKSTFPYYMYDLRFVDERIDSFYHTEQITSALFKAFAILAIFISCLGLYGLVSFMAVQKTKEVGIRKVLGASVQSIVYMFSREFTILIGVAFLISAPLGYYFMHSWLSGFFYHVSLGWGVFVSAIAFSVVIAWITVGYKALRAAVANPVKSLRSE